MKDKDKDKDRISYVGLVRTEHAVYPSKRELFRPDEAYPEYMFDEVASTKNEVYAAVRESFRLLGLDKDHYGTEEWNPLGEIVHKGDRVLIKPNLVLDQNTNKWGGNECLYTQPAVVAPVLDYVFKALHGTGSVILGDAPMQECDFDALVEQSGYRELTQYYVNKGMPLELLDFRKDVTTVNYRICSRETKENVPSTIVNLGKESEFYGVKEIDSDKLRIVEYPHNNLVKHHHDTVHEYCVSSYVLGADVIINMPKPKTHKKAGMTGALKNIVGINSKKDFLPHHTFGSVEEGGDEYLKKNWLQRVRSNLYDKKYQYEEDREFLKARFVWFFIAMCTLTFKLLRLKYENGSWYGNNTISKTIIDLNKILFFADKNGVLQREMQRRYFIVADMIISGQKDGPVAPSPKKIGAIAVSNNPVCFDEALATLMGFDYNKIPTLVQARKAKKRYNVSNGKERTVIVSNDKILNGRDIRTITCKESFQYVTSAGWEGHIELEK